MINGKGHDYTLDWWTLGVTMYEMLVGLTPFYNKNKQTMYELIQFSPVEFPTFDVHGFELS